MPTQIQLRRGTTSQNGSFTGAAGELSIDTDLDQLRVHDGSTAGGVYVPTGKIGGLKQANVAGTQSELVTSGVIMGYGGATIPNGFLLCDGSAISRSTYSRLFTAIATAFGVGNGNNTFNIPNLGDALMMGKGANNSTLGTQTHAMPASSTKPSESTSIAAHSLTTATFATSAKDSSTSSAVTAVATHAAITPNMIFPTVVVNFIIKE